MLSTFSNHGITPVYTKHVPYMHHYDFELRNTVLKLGV